MCLAPRPTIDEVDTDWNRCLKEFLFKLFPHKRTPTQFSCKCYGSLRKDSDSIKCYGRAKERVFDDDTRIEAVAINALKRKSNIKYSQTILI